MIEVEDKLLADDIFEEYFECNLSECKGECCIEGDSGAPLEEEEIAVLEDNYELFKPFMTSAGIEAVERDGVFVIDSDGDYTTTLINGGECAFVVREGDIALCAIEKAFRAGLITNIKPISCALYPIRRKRFKNGMEGLNYHRWDVCRSACTNGEQTGSKVYQCAKGALVRAYGEEFYGHLEEIDRILTEGLVEEE